jgi:hypothetical protein
MDALSSRQLIDLLERYDLIFSLDLIHNPLTEDFLSSLINMLNLKSGYSQIFKILECLYEIIELEISSPSSCSSIPSPSDCSSPIIEFILRSSLIHNLEVLYINFHFSANLLRLIGELLALFGQHQLHFPLYGKKKNTLLSRILTDIFSQKMDPYDLSNYCHGLDALCNHKIRLNGRILEDYRSCLSQLKTEPKNLRLACELFGLMLVTDWSSHGAFFNSKVLSSSFASSCSNFASPPTSPAAPPSIISSLSRSLSRTLSRSLSLSSPAEDMTPLVQLILDTSLSCFDYHLKLIPRHLPSRRYFIQMACHAYRTVYLSFHSQEAEDSNIFSAIAPYQGTILRKMQALYQDLSGCPPCSLPKSLFRPHSGRQSIAGTDNSSLESVLDCLRRLEAAVSSRTASIVSETGSQEEDLDEERAEE